ncbi:MAG: NAD-dependent epimerase/dehydratase family protein [bacterium]
MAEPVLLTGATGFVGRAVLADLVAQGVPVHAVSRQPGPGQPGVTWHRADLLNPADRANLTTSCQAGRLIHCAWQVEHGAFWTSPANALWRAASSDLIEGFLTQGGGRVLAVGTCAEYDAADKGPWNEERRVAPATPYGAAKAGLHADLAELCGNRLVWARLFHLYGPGEDPRRFIPAVAKALRAGQPAEVRAADLVRDYASTAHVARCLAALLDSAVCGAVDVGSGQPRSLGALARIVARSVAGEGYLRLTHRPTPDDPPRMEPELVRLFGATGLDREQPETSLARYAGDF